MNNFILSIITYCLLINICIAQNKSIIKADSLLKINSSEIIPILKTLQLSETSDIEKVKIHNLYTAYYLQRMQIDSAYKYALEYYQLAIDLKDDKHKIKSQNYLGEIYSKKGEYKKAILELEKAYDLGLKTDNSYLIARTLSNQSFIYYSFKHETKSIELLQEALSRYRLLGDKLNTSYIYNNLGIIHKKKKEYDISIKYLQKSYLISLSLKDTLGMASSTNNIGNTLMMLGYNQKALIFLNYSLEYYNSLNQEELSLYSNIASIEKKLHNNKKSLFFMNKALVLAEKQKEPQKTIQLLAEISDFYSQTKSWQLAYFYQKKYSKYKEALYNKELPEIIDKLKAEAKIKLKEETISILEEKNTFQSLYLKQKNILIACLIILIILILVSAYNYHQKKQSDIISKQIQIEQKLLRAQMNPHFFFNTLTNIQAYIFNNNTKEAVKYIAKFALLMRKILENSRDSLVSLEKEIELNNIYVYLQRKRLNNTFDFYTDIDESVDSYSTEIPPMIFQIFIENAIEHGVRHLKNKRGEIHFKIKIIDNNLNISIRDNGIGRKLSAEINKSLKSKHKSHGENISRERLNLLVGKNKTKAKLQISDLYDNEIPSGTLVEILIPLN